MLGITYATAPPNGVGLHARLRVPVDRGAVAGEPDEAHDVRLEPPHEPLDPRRAVAVLRGSQLRGADGRPLHQVGHADAGGGAARARDRGRARHEAGVDRPRGQKRLLGPGEARRPTSADAQARVQPAHEDGACPGPTKSGSVRAAVAADVDPVVVAPSHSRDVEAGARSRPRRSGSGSQKAKKRPGKSSPGSALPS